LVGLDLQKGIPRAIELLPEIKSEDAALDFWRVLLAQKGAAPALTTALPKSGLPAPVVKAGLRAAREGGRNEPNLVLALARRAQPFAHVHQRKRRSRTRRIDLSPPGTRLRQLPRDWRCRRQSRTGH